MHSYCRGCINEYNKIYREKRRAENKLRRQKQAEINARLQAAISAPKPPSKEPPPPKRFAVEPFRLWLQRKVQIYSITNVAASVGVSPRVVYRLLHENTDYVTISTLDKFFIAFQEHPRDLYGSY